MEMIAKTIETPVGFFEAPLHPLFEGQLAECETDEDLFELVDNDGFINPDAFNEVTSRGLYNKYNEWVRGK